MSEPTIIRSGALTPTQRAAVESLVDLVTSHDGVVPLNEMARFAVAGQGHAVHWLVWDECTLVGYAQCDRDTSQAQLLVAPAWRRRGIGTMLARAVLELVEHPSWWAFGTSEGAQALASRLGAVQQRQLLVMELDLARDPADIAPLPEGIVLRGFTSSDADRVVEVNAEAFSHHPEQGDMTLADFELRTRESWFDPQGLLLAFDDELGCLAGFHWTKIAPADPEHPDELIGEVYVIGVAPRYEGRGIGRLLLQAGLAHMSERGVQRVRLYVQSDEERVVGLYKSARFVTISRDTGYQS